MPNGLSFEMYLNQWLAKSKYGAKYLANPQLIPRESLKQSWIESLIEIAENEALSEIAIDSFIKEFGENVLLQTFRGVCGKGLIGYIPKDMNIAHKQNPMMF
jgi:hypothetical protein